MKKQRQPRIALAASIIIRRTDYAGELLTAPYSGPEDGEFDDALARRARNAGSGVIVDPRGIALASARIVGLGPLEVALADGTLLKAEVVGVDWRTDVAVLRIQGDAPLPYVALGNADHVRVGDWVVAVGAPLGLAGTVTAGVITALPTPADPNPLGMFLQTDAAIGQGFVGGPLIAMNGELVGLAAALRGEGIAYALPSGTVRKIYRELLEKGRVSRPWLGAIMQRHSADLARVFGTRSADGVLIADVLPKSPAAGAGLRSGDVILEIDGHAAPTPKHIERTISLRSAGETIRLKVRRTTRELVVSAWRDHALNDAIEKKILDRYGGWLTVEHHRARIDRLLYPDEKGATQAALRVSKLLSADEQKKVAARIAVIQRGGNAGKLLDALPSNAVEADVGLRFNRIQWLRRTKDKDRREQAWKMLLDAPSEPNVLLDLNNWWTERRINCRGALNDGNPKVAYEIAAKHGLVSGDGFIEAEFLAGWRLRDLLLGHRRDRRRRRRAFHDDHLAERGERLLFGGLDVARAAREVRFEIGRSIERQPVASRPVPRRGHLDELDDIARMDLHRGGRLGHASAEHDARVGHVGVEANVDLYRARRLRCCRRRCTGPSACWSGCSRSDGTCWWRRSSRRWYGSIPRQPARDGPARCASRWAATWPAPPAWSPSSSRSAESWPVPRSGSRSARSSSWAGLRSPTPAAAWR